jgi:hypothetical protein
MREKFTKFPWLSLLYTGATLAAFLLAAGARWKN